MGSIFIQSLFSSTTVIYEHFGCKVKICPIFHLNFENPTANTTQRYNFYSTEIDFEDAKGAAYATHAFAGRKKNAISKYFENI